MFSYSQFIITILITVFLQKICPFIEEYTIQHNKENLYIIQSLIIKYG